MKHYYTAFAFRLHYMFTTPCMFTQPCFSAQHRDSTTTNQNSKVVMKRPIWWFVLLWAWSACSYAAPESSIAPITAGHAMVGAGASAEVATDHTMQLALDTIEAPKVENDRYSLHGWYYGIGLGQARIHLHPEALQQRLAQQTPAYTATILDDDSLDRHSGALKLYLGVPLTESWALETAVMQFERFAFNVLATPNIVLQPMETMRPELGLVTIDGSPSPQRIRATLRTQAIHLNAVGSMALNPQWSVVGRAGLFYHNSKALLTGSEALDLTGYDKYARALGYNLGVGIAYQPQEQWQFRLEWERYPLRQVWNERHNVSLLTLGVLYRLGEDWLSSPTPAPVTPVEVRIEQEPEVAFITPAPNAPVPSEPAVVVVLNDVHFEFDQSSLTSAAKGILQQHIAKLRENPRYLVQIEGYTSASGTAAYNLALSQRRAMAVQHYLETSGGIASHRLRSLGLGESSPAQYEADPGDLLSVAARANMRVLFRLQINP
jgi:OOP family OmpA-OmpF porin